MQLQELYRKYAGCEPSAVTPLTPAGSSRRYYRLTGPVTVVGVVGTDADENHSFIYLSRHFASLRLPVPEVLAVSDDGMSYLVTDLGDVSLFSVIGDTYLVEKTMRALARLHNVGSRGLDYSRCFPVEAFDERAVMWDLNYFKYSFLNTSGIAYSEPRLEEDFRCLARRVGELTEREGCFMMRDCQSRNVMVKDGDVYFIDFQGGRRGPAAYDLASFLWQAKAGFTPAERDRYIDAYIDDAAMYAPVDVVALKSQVREMALIRILQVLGAYGLRGRFERKPHFLQSIPKALDNLRTLLDEGIGDYPYLTEVLHRLIEKSRADSPAELPAYDGLTVRVTSFSYKKGIPEDPSGNGGGYVFDCRAMDNPGRYDEYKRMTGLDAGVIGFLERRGEIQEFLAACYSLVDRAVDNYLERGFTSLSVNYGCTGGQHRSVYSAQHTAEHIKERYPQVRVILTHREQGITEVL
ncbi:MAG: phosphotransferase [Duncaniella sp.]|nr:phosphotransferase [Duncaniella sp.]